LIKSLIFILCLFFFGPLYSSDLFCRDFDFDFDFGINQLHQKVSSVPTFIKTMNIESANFIQENIRGLYGEELVNKSFEQRQYLNQYLQNLKLSIELVFDPWFRSGKSSAQLKNLLKAQHTILINGYKEKNAVPFEIYRGFMGGVKGTTDVSAGMMIHELAVRELHIANLILRGRGALELELEGPFPAITQIHGIAEELRRNGHNPEDLSDNYVSGAFPRNYIDKSGRIIHSYPRFFRHIQQIYLDRMSFVLSHIENCLLRPNSETPIINVLLLIGEYYHVGINAHFFERGNNSILMSHVNYFLKYMGLQPIRHQYWDYVALINNSYDFERIFINAIKEVNPNMRLTLMGL
jgi:hypothetical protein